MSSTREIKTHIDLLEVEYTKFEAMVGDLHSMVKNCDEEAWRFASKCLDIRLLINKLKDLCLKMEVKKEVRLGECGKPHACGCHYDCRSIGATLCNKCHPVKCNNPNYGKCKVCDCEYCECEWRKVKCESPTANEFKPNPNRKY